MATRYAVSGQGPAANTTANTAGIVKAQAASTILASLDVYEAAIYPGSAAADNNYVAQFATTTTAGTWTGVTAAPLDPASAAAKSTAGGVNSTGASTVATTLFFVGFNQRGGIRWVAVPSSELAAPRANSGGIIATYTGGFCQGTDAMFGTLLFFE